MEEGNYDEGSEGIDEENERLKKEVISLKDDVRKERFYRKLAENKGSVKIFNTDNTVLEKILVPIFGEGAARTWVSFYLGSLFGLGIAFYFLSTRLYDLGIYMILVGLFHMWEYSYVSIFRPTELRIEHYMIDHSKAFVLAYLGTIVEYIIEAWLFPWMKGYRIIVYTGLLICVIGQAVRTISMFQCGKNFNHCIEMGQKRDDHELVTVGLYKYFRHPSYFGWFYWSIFTQVVLMNPICLAGFSYASWKFFNYRIHCEELELLQQFGSDYMDYRERVGIYIPFIDTLPKKKEKE